MSRNELTIVRHNRRDDRRRTRQPSDEAGHVLRAVASDAHRPVFRFRLAALG